MERHLNDLQPSIRDPLMQSLQQMDHDLPNMAQQPGHGRQRPPPPRNANPSPLMGRLMEPSVGSSPSHSTPPAPPDEEDFRTCQFCGRFDQALDTCTTHYYSVLTTTQYSVLTTTQYSLLLNTTHYYSVLTTTHYDSLLLSTQYSVLSTQYSVLSTHYSP